MFCLNEEPSAKLELVERFVTIFSLVNSLLFMLVVLCLRLADSSDNNNLLFDGDNNDDGER